MCRLNGSQFSPFYQQRQTIHTHDLQQIVALFLLRFVGGNRLHEMRVDQYRQARCALDADRVVWITDRRGRFKGERSLEHADATKQDLHPGIKQVIAPIERVLQGHMALPPSLEAWHAEAENGSSAF